MKQYKASQWQGGSGRWYVDCVDDLGGKSGLWWVPCRILGISPCDFVLLLKDKFNASHFSYRNDVLIYSWDKDQYADAHRWLLYLNKIAREKQIII